jgi:hypothetical protein
MQNFIVLGIIPGTQIQIDFYTWLIIFSSLFVLSVLALKRHSLRTAVLAWYVARLIRHQRLAA